MKTTTNDYTRLEQMAAEIQAWLDANVRVARFTTRPIYERDNLSRVVINLHLPLIEPQQESDQAHYMIYEYEYQDHHIDTQLRYAVSKMFDQLVDTWMS